MVERLGIALQEPEFPMRATLLGGAQYRLQDRERDTNLHRPRAFAAARGRASSFVASGP